jgi:hypothetical protein
MPPGEGSGTVSERSEGTINSVLRERVADRREATP